MLNMASILISLIYIISLSPAIAGISNVESDIDDLQTYMVYVQKPRHGNFLKEIDLESWYHSFLPATISSNSIDDDPQSRMVHCYRHVISGFAARLTAEEVKAMETKNGFISAHVENTLQLHTTHTPNFLGLHQNSGFWKDSNLGKGVIIGVLDSGITPTHPSFSDKDMPPPPAKWRGKCEFAGGAGCNNKIIGARNFYNLSLPPIDDGGHGTHTSSTAAGTFVNGANRLGEANGTAVGMAPLAHFAMYKTCDDYADNCPESSVNAALDAAIEDGVDVLSLSIGLGPDQHKEFHANAIAIATFKAVKKGIFLGNQETYDGESLLQWTDIPSEQLPLVYPVTKNASATTNCPPETLKSIDVKGKVVLCQLSVDPQDVLDASGAAMILMNNKLIGDSIVAGSTVLPHVRVSYTVGESIKAYINSTSSPTAALVVKGTVIGRKTAPEVAAFSSRGPSTVSPGILKPDIIGPGVNIIAAWLTAVEPVTNTEYTFDIISGTSMSCPHLSGIAALLKSAHPDWSPAAIKSEFMTTVDTVNLEGKPILDRNHLPADLFAVGAGHVNPSKANDPGLIYNIQPDDYIPYLCGLNYTDQQVQGIVGGDVQCSKVPSIAEAELNYPSFSIRLESGPQTYNRTITNVGPANSSYTSQIVAPEGVEITVQPNKISFTEKNQKVAYSVTFTRTKNTGASSAQANLSWIFGQYTGKSPIAISFI
ncbi:hypothetical protein KPL70_003216 [Citrus sinensis]|nr:hypothetical protein KPL70_003216 [Citrus sinensis]